MDIQKQKACILLQLKKRNAKEHSFKELIKYSNKLLASLDYLQKETMFRKHQTTEPLSSESLLNSEVSKSEESTLASKCISLQEELKHCHVKISEFAQQIIDLKNIVEEKNDSLLKKTTELDRIQKEMKRCKELNETYQKQLSNLKAILQDKTDEFDALNITFSSVENKKNDLEIEVKKLKDELYLLKSLDKSFLSSESSRSASITSALLSAANDISVGPAAKALTPERKEIFTPKAVFKQHVSAIPTKLKFDFVAHDSEVNAVLWLPQMLYFVTAGHDRKVKLWEMCESGAELKENIRGCNSSILSVDIDPEANLLLCASSDFASRVWTMCDFTIRHTLTGHSGKVTSSKFLSETNRIISGSSDQTLKMWDLRQRVCIMTYSTSSPVNDVTSRPSNFVISGHSDKKIRIWDPRVGNEVAHISCSRTVTSLDLSKNSYFLLASERGNCLKIFDMRVFKETSVLQASNFEIDCDLTRAKFSPDNKYCCCGSRNGSVFIWNVASQAVEKELKGHTSGVSSCCWSTCGTYLISCDKNKRCFVWN